MSDEISEQRRNTKLSVLGVAKEFPLRRGQMIQAVVDMSFDVLNNELCLILGPSGCGKSTLLRMVAGLEEPTAGSITLKGAQITGPGDRLLSPARAL